MPTSSFKPPLDLPHQTEGTQFLRDNTAAALFDEQGLGKSKQVIDALSADPDLRAVVTKAPGQRIPQYLAGCGPPRTAVGPAAGGPRRRLGPASGQPRFRILATGAGRRRNASGMPEPSSGRR